MSTDSGRGTAANTWGSAIVGNGSKFKLGVWPGIAHRPPSTCTHPFDPSTHFRPPSFHSQTAVLVFGWGPIPFPPAAYVPHYPFDVQPVDGEWALNDIFGTTYLFQCSKNARSDWGTIMNDRTAG